MKTLVLANQKGGVGKSAIATQLAHYLNRIGFLVLVIDLDHQGNTSAPLAKNGSVTVAPFSASALLAGEGAALPIGTCVLVPSDTGLSNLEKQPDKHNQYVNNLAQALRDASHFDICIIDTNPNPDIRYGAAVICANYVLAPVQLNQEALHGIATLLGNDRYGLARIKTLMNPELEFVGILPNLVEPTPFQRGNLEALIAKHASRMLSDGNPDAPAFGYIQKRSAIAEAQSAAVFLPDLKKTAAYDTWREVKPVFDMVLNRMGLRTGVEPVL